MKSDLFLIILFIFHGKVLMVKFFATNPASFGFLDLDPCLAAWVGPSHSLALVETFPFHMVLSLALVETFLFHI